MRWALLVAIFAGCFMGCRAQKREITLQEKMVENVRSAIDVVMDNITEGDEWFGKAMRAPDVLVRRRFLNIALDHYCAARRLLLEQMTLARDPYVGPQKTPLGR